SFREEQLQRVDLAPQRPGQACPAAAEELQLGFAVGVTRRQRFPEGAWVRGRGFAANLPSPCGVLEKTFFSQDVEDPTEQAAVTVGDTQLASQILRREAVVHLEPEAEVAQGSHDVLRAEPIEFWQ